MFTNEPWILSNAIFLAIALRNLYNDVNRSQLANALVGGGGLGVTLSDCEPTRNQLRGLRIQAPGLTVFLFDGARRNDTARDIAYSYMGVPNENPGFGENVALANLAINTFAALGGLPSPRREQICFAGYSAGAAVALFLASVANEAPAGSNISACLFNSPRPAVREWASRAPAVQAFRWHNDDDPIAHLPLWSSEAPALGGLTSAETARRCNRYTQFSRGVSISKLYNTLQLAPGESPVLSTVEFASQVGWATGIDDDAVQGHSLVELLFRLVGYDILHQPVASNEFLVGNQAPYSDGGFGVAAQPGEPVPALTNQEAGNRGAIGVPELLAAIDAPSSGLTIVNGGAQADGGSFSAKPFYAQKINKKYYVMYLTTIMYGPVPKQQAKRDASHLNGLTKRAALSATDNASGLGDAVKDESLGNVQ